MDCREVTLLLAALEPGESPAGELAAHLGHCAACRATAARLAAVDAALGAWGEGFEPAAGFDARVMARIEAEAAGIRRAAAFRAGRELDLDAVRAALRRSAWRRALGALLDSAAAGVVGLVLVTALLGQLQAHALLPGNAGLLAGLGIALAAAGLALVTRDGRQWLAAWVGPAGR